MGQYIAPIRDMQFVLHEFLNVSDELKQIPKFEDVDADIINQVLEEGAKFTSEVLFPLNHSGDREGCHFDVATKAVTTPRASRRPTSSTSTAAGRHSPATPNTAARACQWC